MSKVVNFGCRLNNFEGKKIEELLANNNENMVVINPDECIDCGVCEPECPIDAIKPDTDDSIEDKEKWLLINKKYSALWPNISKRKDPMKEHEKFKNIKNKYKEHFSEKPGK